MTNQQDLRERLTQAFIEQDRATDDATKLEDRVDLAIEVFGKCRPGMMCRPEVAAFAMLMEAQLKANDHKPGWGSDSLLSLHERLEEEARELWGEIRPDPDTGIAAYDHEAIEKEAADVANFAMMIVSNLGALRKHAALISPPDPGSSGLLRDRVKAVREKQGLSIRALGDLTGLNFSTLARFERGEGELSIENKAALRDWLKILEPEPAPPDPGLASLVGEIDALEKAYFDIPETEITENPQIYVLDPEIFQFLGKIADFLSAFDKALPKLRTALGGGWRPMSEAPKDGTEIVLLCDFGPIDPQCPIFAKWCDEDGGWWCCRDGWEVENPTDWIPLPQPTKEIGT